MRVQFAIAGCLGALLLLGQPGATEAASAAQVPPVPQPFPSRAGYSVATFTIQPGELAPGEARARRQRGSGLLDHEVRFMVASDRATPVHLYIDGYGESETAVVVTDSQGKTSRRMVPIESQGRHHHGVRILIGEGAVLTELTSLVKDAMDRESATLAAKPNVNRTPLAGVQIHQQMDSLAAGCETLAQAESVIAAQGLSNEMLDCVARGARVLAIGGSADGGCLALGAQGVAWQQGATCATPVDLAWGTGTLVWVPDLAAAATFIAGRALAESNLVAEGHWVEDQAGPAWMNAQQVLGEPGEQYGGSAPAWIAFALIFGFVLASIIVGVVVSRKPRSPWVSWAWFPGLSGGVALLILAGTSVWWSGTERALVTDITVVSPTGIGHRVRSLSIAAWQSRTFTAEVPWAGGVPLFVKRQSRFGSPFTPARAGVQLLEDRTTGRAHVSDLSVNRLGRVELSWTEPATETALQVVREADGVKITNAGPSSLQSVSFCSVGLRDHVQKLDPGASYRFTTGKAGPGTHAAEQHNVDPAFRTACAAVSRDGFALSASRTTPGAPGDRTRTTVAPEVETITDSGILMIGTLSGVPAGRVAE